MLHIKWSPSSRHPVGDTCMADWGCSLWLPVVTAQTSPWWFTLQIHSFTCLAYHSLIHIQHSVGMDAAAKLLHDVFKIYAIYTSFTHRWQSALAALGSLWNLCEQFCCIHSPTVLLVLQFSHIGIAWKSSWLQYWCINTSLANLGYLQHVWYSYAITAFSQAHTSFFRNRPLSHKQKYAIKISYSFLF